MKSVKITTAENQGLKLVLRDDGRIFHEPLSTIEAQTQTVSVRRKNLLPWILFAVAQVEVIVLFVLDVMEVL